MLMSRVGRLNSSWQISGFSLVELLVVLFILSILAFFTIPYFSPANDQGSEAGDYQTLARLMTSLKKKAVKENIDYLLHLDQVSGKVWVTQQVSDTAQIQNEEDEKTEDKENTQGIANFSFADIELLNHSDLDSTDTEICFYSQGYSDMAMVQIETEGGGITLKLHPFLLDVEILQRYVSLNDCI